MSTFLKYDDFRGAVWEERECSLKSIGIELVDNANWLPQSLKKSGKLSNVSTRKRERKHNDKK